MALDSLWLRGMENIPSLAHVRSAEGQLIMNAPVEWMCIVVASLSLCPSRPPSLSPPLTSPFFPIPQSHAPVRQMLLPVSPQQHGHGGSCKHQWQCKSHLVRPPLLTMDPSLPVPCRCLFALVIDPARGDDAFSTRPLSLSLQAASRTDFALCRSAATKFVHTATATASARRGTQRGRCGARQDKPPAAHVAIFAFCYRNPAIGNYIHSGCREFCDAAVATYFPEFSDALDAPDLFYCQGTSLGTAPPCLTHSHPPSHPIVIASA